MAAPSTQALLTQWTWQPSVLIGLAVLSAAYFYAIGPLRRARRWGQPASTRQITYFVLSVCTLVVALLSPLDTIGDRYLFSVHMVQHLLLAALWPPLILAAIPAWLARKLLRPPVSWVWAFCCYPAVAIILFNGDIFAWHLPALYDATLSSEGVHILEHLTFMLFGIFVWWPVLSPIVSERQAYPLQVLYLFANGMFMMVLGIVFTFAPNPFYAPYVSAPRLWGISAGTDQQIGGLIMWYPGNLPYAAVLVAAFYRWFDSGESGPVETQRIPSRSPTIGPPAS
jgi:putative membrane protein